MEERLQKIMAHAGFGSRRENEEYIRAGRVRVNGKVASLGDKADPAKDKIVFDDTPIQIEQKIYIMLNKPKGVLSSTEDELDQGRETVRDLVEVEGHIYPVGRLDRQSRGLILLTNDGELAHKLTHPSYGHEKEYHVVIEGVPSDKTIESWRKGVFLEGKRTLPAKVHIVRTENERSFLKITMREGRKRQIRKVAAMLGHPVKQLTRERIGSLRLDKLRMGEWRHLTDAEITALQNIVKNSQRRAPKKGKPAGRRANPRHRTKGKKESNTSRRSKS